MFTDFVELPSQLYEHWQEQPQVLQQFARHYQTGEPLPDDLLKRFLAARKFNQGFATVEFVSSALVDLEFHTQPASASRDVRAFEQAGAGEDRHARGNRDAAPADRSSAISSPATTMPSGYYSYMWSEVMDADAFGAFEEAGDIFDPATAKRLHDDIYSSRRLARSGRGLCRLPRPRARAGRAVAPARPAGGARGGLSGSGV